MKTPLFSILHTSARPDKWRAVYDDWMAKCVHPEDVEYVLVIDPRWGFPTDPAQYDSALDNIVVEVNTGRRCYVDGVNIAARASSGSILIVNADDQFPCERWDEKLKFPCERWDEKLLSVIAAGDSEGWGFAVPFVIEVDCGGKEHERRIMPMPILSRARYEKLGYVFFPEYESMWADNDFFEAANRDGIVIDARHLLFPHRHPMIENWKGRNDERWDAAYQAQNRVEAYEIGKKIFEKRSTANFQKRRLIALCLPGEQFSGAYLDAILALQAHLLLDLPDFEVVALQTFRKYTSNPYITREDIRRALAAMPVKPELCLWIDDDNILSVAGFDQLLSDLNAHPEVDGVSAWCWIHNEHKAGFMVSCGMWSPDYMHWDPFSLDFAYRQNLETFETGGLPCILMRYSALEKAQTGALELGTSGAFLPIMDAQI